ncbi:MAG: DUF2059 domain-containing protein [Chthoniobacterales bacterium]|nr:DUF2059 domain-containing protein [Chthoniobacterales bacterium]
MKKILVGLLFLNLSFLPVAHAQDANSSHYKAAEQMLSLMDMETILRRSIDEMLKAQIAQNPSIAPFESVMRAFLLKHMSWDSLKADTIKIYTAEFTEPELNEMNKFYQTPTGKKMVEKLPTLMGRGAEIGAKRVQDHMPELEAAMMEEAKKQAAAGSGAGASPAAPAPAAGAPAAPKATPPPKK